MLTDVCYNFWSITSCQCFAHSFDVARIEALVDKCFHLATFQATDGILPLITFPSINLLICHKCTVVYSLRLQ